MSAAAHLAATVAHLMRRRSGFHLTPQGYARFRRGALVDASPALWHAYQLRAAHFEQIGF